MARLQHSWNDPVKGSRVNVGTTSLVPSWRGTCGRRRSGAEDPSPSTGKPCTWQSSGSQHRCGATGETGASWPGPVEAESRVLAMQTKLHQWAMADSGRHLYNLVYDPAFLVVAWSEEIKGHAAGWMETAVHRPGTKALLVGLRESLNSGLRHNQCARRPSRKRATSSARWGFRQPQTGSCKPPWLVLEPTSRRIKPAPTASARDAGQRNC